MKSRILEELGIRTEKSIGVSTEDINWLPWISQLNIWWEMFIKRFDDNGDATA